jgi:hypothetical protein
MQSLCKQVSHSQTFSYGLFCCFFKIFLTFLILTSRVVDLEPDPEPDPYSIRSVDPDPYSESGSGSRRAKMTHKSRQ